MIGTVSRVAGTVAVATLLLAGVAHAQDPRLDAARKEGRVVWYTSLVLPSAEKIAKIGRASCRERV